MLSIDPQYPGKAHRLYDSKSTNLNYASVFMSYCYVPECCNPRDVSFTEGARLRHFECVINLSRNLLFIFDYSTVM